MDDCPFLVREEQDFLQELIWQVADFSGIQVVTHAIMANHFHILAEVPSSTDRISDDELIRRFSVLYPSPTLAQPLTAEGLRVLLESNDSKGEELRKSLHARMGDPSWFMKTVNQRFALWLNRTRERVGAVWHHRYKDVLVQNDPWALAVVSAYIDLNPVRARIVKDPANYEFCGLGKAHEKDARASEGLKILSDGRGDYDELIEGARGSRGNGPVGSVDQQEIVDNVSSDEDPVPLSVALRCRVRYFTDGMIIGFPDFVEKHANAVAVCPKRPRIAHPMLGTDWKGLAVATGLRKNVFQRSR